MFPGSRDFLMFAGTSAIIALSAAAHSPYAETLATIKAAEVSVAPKSMVNRTNPKPLLPDPKYVDAPYEHV